MPNFGVMQDRISDELDDSDLRTGGQIGNAIRSAIELYRDNRFWFNQVIEKSFTILSGVEYQAPAITVTGLSTTEPLTVIDLVKMDDGTGSNYRKVVQVDNSYIDAAQPGTITRRPEYFALVADADGTRIRWFPFPDQTYTPVITALIRYADLSGDTDTNPWTNDAETLIRLAAKRILKTEVTHELPYDAPPSAAEQMALSALLRSSRLRKGSAPLRTEVARMQGHQIIRPNIYTDG